MLPVSVVIPTRERPAALARALRSLLASTVVPEEFVIIDASAGRETTKAVEALFNAQALFSSECPRLVLRPAATTGAAAQRNQGVALATCEIVLFCDDDIIAEPDCVLHLWQALRNDTELGGVSASIVNQSYRRPGLAMRVVLRLIGGPEGETYAGRVVGPAVNFLPRLQATESAVPVEWLNLTFTMYRRAVLSSPPLDAFFTGYSFGEDLALSLRVSRQARLANVPLARIVHDSQAGAHKTDAVSLSRMQFVNRHYIMTQVLGRSGVADHLRLLLWEGLQLAITAWRQRGGAGFWRQARGRLSGLRAIARGRLSERAP